MTVKELQEILKDCQQDVEVFVAIKDLSEPENTNNETIENKICICDGLFEELKYVSVGWRGLTNKIPCVTIVGESNYWMKNKEKNI